MDPWTKVRNTCRLNYTKINDIEKHKKGKLNFYPTVKNSVRVSTGPYDSKGHYLKL